MFKQHYHIKPGGNCDLSPRSDPHGEFQGLNVLISISVARQSLSDIAQPAADAGVAGGGAVGAGGGPSSEQEVTQLLAQCHEELFLVREKRPRPHRDDKARCRR